MAAYYNEIEPFMAAWLRELIKAGHIADGVVDERSIEDVQPTDLMEFTQCHFFAGIGGWSRAFRLAGWGDDRKVWSGSAPCQPYSIANPNSLGQEDTRHLLPHFLRLIEECKPPVIYGEQVTNAIRWNWLDECFSSLEDKGYACGSAVLTASGYGADHERKRLYWVADSDGERWEGPIPNYGVSLAESPPLTQHSDCFSYTRSALAGDIEYLLQRDGLPLAVERLCLKGYGNAIVPEVAAEFVRAFMGPENGKG